MQRDATLLAPTTLPRAARETRRGKGNNLATHWAIRPGDSLGVSLALSEFNASSAALSQTSRLQHEPDTVLNFHHNTSLVPKWRHGRLFQSGDVLGV